MSKLLPPFHKVMHSGEECFSANDRVAELERSVKEYDQRHGEMCHKIAQKDDHVMELTADVESLKAELQTAEAQRNRFSAILDSGLTTMNTKQDIVGTLALRDAAIAYDADKRSNP